MGGACSCRPIGSLVAVKPHGSEIAATPARFALTVYKSPKYMANGSSHFSPSR